MRVMLRNNQRFLVDDESIQAMNSAQQAKINADKKATTTKWWDSVMYPCQFVVWNFTNDFRIHFVDCDHTLAQFGSVAYVNNLNDIGLRPGL